MIRTRSRSWLRLLQATQSRSTRLVCFPHAGGSATSYASWSAALPPEVELVAVQYPGRGDRFGEPALDDIVQMSTLVASELLALDPAPLALFGHSLGALMAYETALALRCSGVSPHLIVVSGSPPPARAGGGLTHLGTDDELWSTVCSFGGTEPEIAKNLELRSVLLPTLRSDVRANEIYRPAADVAPLSCPVRCYHGIGDPLVDDNYLTEWASITTGPFSICHRPGGHSHVLSNTRELVADIVDALPRFTAASASPVPRLRERVS